MKSIRFDIPVACVTDRGVDRAVTHTVVAVVLRTDFSWMISDALARDTLAEALS